MTEEKRDCRWCGHSDATSPEDNGRLICYSGGSELIEDPEKDALKCPCFNYCDLFPKTLKEGDQMNEEKKIDERDCESCKNYKDTGEGYRACSKWNCKYERRERNDE